MGSSDYPEKPSRQLALYCAKLLPTQNGKATKTFRCRQTILDEAGELRADIGRAAIDVC
jgi:hypothetical protein